MFFLLTALVSLGNDFLYHLASTNMEIGSNSWIGELGHLTYSPSKSYRIEIHEKDGVSCMCFGEQTGDFNSISMAIVHDYLKRRRLSIKSYYKNYPSTSCSIYDKNTSLIYIVSDTVGAYPLWLSFFNPDNFSKSGQLIITNDFLGAKRIGFTEITPIGPGQVMAYNLVTRQIRSIWHWQSQYLKATRETFIMRTDYYALKLFATSMNAIKNKYKSIQLKPPNITIEINTMDELSRLMHCTVDALNFSRNIRFTRAPVYHETVFSNSILNSILGTNIIIFYYRLLHYYSVFFIFNLSKLILRLFLIDQMMFGNQGNIINTNI